jgi:hypothetical protein
MKTMRLTIPAEALLELLKGPARTLHPESLSTADGFVAVKPG